VRLYTSRYQRFQPTQGAPIRSTAGHPRFRLDYRLAGHATLITPMRWMLEINDEARYRAAYSDMLTSKGLAAIQEELTTLATAASNEQLVLLCFCDLTVPPPNNWCHRRIFADWWQNQTDIDVPELTDPQTVEPMLF
jgi:hypothetical protein